MIRNQMSHACVRQVSVNNFFFHHLCSVCVVVNCLRFKIIETCLLEDRPLSTVTFFFKEDYLVFINCILVLFILFVCLC